MSLKDPFALAICVLAGVFALLGGLFAAMPIPATALYGLSSQDPAALFYVRAIGLRDLALAAYLLGLTIAGERRSLCIVLTGTLIIPIGDLLLLVSSGAGTPAHYLLHGTSLLCFAGLALWIHRTEWPR